MDREKVKEILREYIQGEPDRQIDALAQTICQLDTSVKGLSEALKDKRQGKSLDLTEEEYELFWAIHNEGVSNSKV